MKRSVTGIGMRTVYREVTKITGSLGDRFKSVLRRSRALHSTERHCRITRSRVAPNGAAPRGAEPGGVTGAFVASTPGSPPRGLCAVGWLGGAVRRQDPPEVSL